MPSDNTQLLNTDGQQEDSIYVDNTEVYNKKIQAIAPPEKQIGIDTQGTIFSNIIKEGERGGLDIAALESFTNVSRNRDQIYSLLDLMCNDSTISAVLETYAEDATEYNENGQVMWAESSDPNIASFANFLLDAMNVDKNIYKWVHSLCKYGDLYLRLYRKSEYEDDDLLKDEPQERKRLVEDWQSLEEERLLKELKASGSDKVDLKEDVNVIAYPQNDHYVHYIEMMPNPAEMFELTRFGKSYAYVKADINTVSAAAQGNNQVLGFNQSVLNYRFKKKDVDLFGPTEFVHACLEDNSSRTPEEVNLFFEKDSDSNTDNNIKSPDVGYTVKRGQSLLYNVFKIWRELSLLENSIILNRVTKSAIIRIIGVEVGDMPKEMVGPHLQGIKGLIEQKIALKTGDYMNEYTNPGPVENNIYVPTHDGKGAITTDQIGGDVNVGQLTDLDYFQDKLFGALRVPKQFFGITDDNAGFSGGQSLSIISSRYAKMVKRIQNTICQAITDVLNLMFLDKGLKGYVNKFTIRMQPPVTQEEIDRRDNLSAKVQLTADIMNMLSDIEDPASKLKILKSLLSNILTDPEVITIIQEQIEQLEAEGVEEDAASDSEIEPSTGMSMASEESGLDTSADLSSIMNEPEEGVEEVSETEGSEETVEPLPSPAELGTDLDFTDNNEF